MTNQQWKKLLRREGFYIKTGRFPKAKELRGRKRKPRLMFGYNTVSR